MTVFKAFKLMELSISAGTSNKLVIVPARISSKQRFVCVYNKAMLKMMKNKKMVIALFATLCLLFLHVSCVVVIEVYAIENEPLVVETEQKIYETVKIEDDFDDSCVLVVMNRYSSAVNKSHNDLMSYCSLIESIEE